MRKRFRWLWIHVLMRSYLALCCCLNISLFCPPRHFLFCNHKASVWYASLPLSQTMLDCGGRISVVSPLQFPLHLHYSCASVAVYVWTGEHEVKRLGLQLMRSAEPTEREKKKTWQQSQQQQHGHKYHLALALTSVLQRKYIWTWLEPGSTWVGIRNNTNITFFWFH